MGRIVRTRLTTLVAMLSVRYGEPPVPPFWVGVMRDKERWAQIVKSVHFFESALDNRAAMKSTTAARLASAVSVI